MPRFLSRVAIAGACAACSSPPPATAPPRPTDIVAPPPPADTEAEEETEPLAEEPLTLHRYADLGGSNGYSSWRMEGFDNGLLFMPDGGFGVETVWLDEDGTVSMDERRWNGIGELTRMEQIHGRFPGDLWARTVRSTGGPHDGTVWRYTGTQWDAVAGYEVPCGSGFAATDMAPWDGGMTALFEQNAWMVERPPAGPFCLATLAAAAPPEPGPVLEAHEQKDENDRYSWDFNPQRVVPFDDGSLIVLDETGSEVRALHVGKNDERRLVTVPLRPTGSEAFSRSFFVARRPHHLAVAADSGSPTLARYDGSRWEALPVPADAGELHGLAFTDTGELLLLTTGALLRRAASGAWTRLTTTPTLTTERGNPLSMALMGGDLWLVAEGYLWSTREPLLGEVQTIVEGDQYFREYPQYHVTALPLQIPTSSLAWPKKADEHCTRIWVQLAPMKEDDLAHDFPAIRKAVAGARGLEEVRFVQNHVPQGRFFGAEVPSLAAGKTLKSRVERRVPGSKPELLCHWSRTVAELPVDLATGETTGWRPATRLPRPEPAPAPDWQPPADGAP